MSLSREVIAILEWVVVRFGNFLDLVGSVFSNSLKPETIEGLLGLFAVAIILRILDSGPRKVKEVVVRREHARDERDRD